MAVDEHSVPLALVTERILLGALREQDAAIVAQAARGRAEFLAEAGLRFGASLDEELTYAAIASVTLAGFDAWSIVDVMESDGTPRRLTVVHRDADEQVVARTLAQEWAPDAADPIGIPAVIRAGASLTASTSADEVALAALRDLATDRILEQLGVGPLLVVPITMRDELLGAITFIGRRLLPGYSTDDIHLADALAMRCAQALDSARLYSAAQAASALARIASADAQAARAEAEAANASKAHFLSRMSHELRTPLNAIGGYAQLMEMGIRGPVTPEQAADLASIQRNQAHLLELVNDVLNYAQVQAGRVTYFSADILLAPVIDAVRDLIAPQIAAKSLQLSIDCPDLSLVVCADASKVRQIMVNLLTNAIKFTPSGGAIDVSCAATAPATAWPSTRVGMHVVQVTDSGIGIARDKLASIFDPFVQVGRELTSSDVGVGLGLAISRDLARGMGGDLTVESEAGRGTTFTLALPSA